MMLQWEALKHQLDDVEEAALKAARGEG